MSVPTPEGLASLLVERLDGTYDDGGDWNIKAHADGHIVAVALDHGDGVGEFRAVIVEGDATPVVAARPYDLENPEDTSGPDALGRDVTGWYTELAADGSHLEFGGSGHVSWAEARRFGAALIALADAKGGEGQERYTAAPADEPTPEALRLRAAFRAAGEAMYGGGCDCPGPCSCAADAAAFDAAMAEEAGGLGG